MKRLLTLAAVFLLTACAKTPDIDYDKSVEFNDYKTFAWMPKASLENTNNYKISSLTEQRVREAVSKQLQLQGMELVDSAVADVLINYHASVETKMDVNTFNTGYSSRWNYWGVGYNTQTTTHEYDVGTLILDVIDHQKNELIWRGAREGRLQKKQNPDQRNETIKEAVKIILSEYPPKVNE